MKTEKRTEISAKQPAKKHERQFSEAAVSMIELMSRIFKAQVLNALSDDTINKFADANFKDANFAREFLFLATKISKKLRTRFSVERLDALVKEQLSAVDKQSKQAFYEKVSKAVGLDPRQLVNEEGLTAHSNALMLETLIFIQKLRDETLQNWVTDTVRLMSEGKTLDDILVQFDNMTEKRKNHADFVTRTQVNMYNSLMTKARAQNLGITRAIWVTAKDERVRPSHNDRNGKEFDLSEGLYSSIDKKHIIPGVDYQCRCTVKLIIPAD
ncbi:MAG: minor capsid protein [Methyloprofundus sp.]|nr:minor capsid protein [Methyloprofundus sp.]